MTRNTTREIKVEISSEIFRGVPAYKRTVVTCEVEAGVDTSKEVSDVLADATLTVQKLLASEDLNEVPVVAAWRAAFRKFGINPSRFRPAIDALVRRAVKGDQLRLGLPLIDVGTAVSLSTMCPVGMHSVDDLDSSQALALRLAVPGDEFTDFSGQTEAVDLGEPVYASGGRVLTRRWVWRQGAVGSMTSSTRLLAVNIDLLDGQDDGAAVSMVTSLLGRCGAGEFGVHRLSLNSPGADLVW